MVYTLVLEASILNDLGVRVPLLAMPEWRNGKRRGLKILSSQGVRVQVPPRALITFLSLIKR